MNWPARRTGMLQPGRNALRLPALALLALGACLWGCGAEPEGGRAVTLRPLWKRDFRGEITLLSADRAAKLLAVATMPDDEGRGDDHLYVLDDQGTVVWQQPLDRKIASTAIAGDGSIVLAYLVDGALVAWSPHGEKLWESSCVGVPEVSASGNRIVCWNTGEESSDGMVLEALDERGRRLWSFDDPGGIWRVSLAEEGDALVALTLAGEVVVIDGRGGVIWRKQLETQVGTVAIASGEKTRIAVGTGIERESLGLYDLAGEELWQTTVPGGTDSIALSGNAAFLVTGNNTVLGQRVYVFDGEGTLGWKYQLDRPAREPLRMQINERGDRVIAVIEEEGQPTLVIWDAHGEVTARMRTGAGIVDYVVSRDGTRIGAITGGGKVVYYVLNSGKEEAESGH